MYGYCLFAVLCSTSSDALLLAEAAAEEGIDLTRLPLRLRSTPFVILLLLST